MPCPLQCTYDGRTNQSAVAGNEDFPIHKFRPDGPVQRIKSECHVTTTGHGPASEELTKNEKRSQDQHFQRLQGQNQQPCGNAMGAKVYRHTADSRQTREATETIGDRKPSGLNRNGTNKYRFSKTL
jgi:hypothetical protein